MIIYFFLILSSWQQSVSYEITGYLDTSEHSLTGVENLKYLNNSPDSIDTIFLCVDANAYQDGMTYFAREAYKMGDEKYTIAESQDRGYTYITEVACGDTLLQYLIEGTILAIPLTKRLGTSDSVLLRIGFYTKIPREFSDFGYWPGHYEMTYWYPRACVYDKKGWHCNQLHPLGRDHGEFANYEVTLDLPWDYVIAAPGRIVNRCENDLIDSLPISKKVLRIGERKKVHILAENLTDFVWVCSRGLGVKQSRVFSTNVNIFCRPGNEQNAEKIHVYAADVIARYTQWFGEYLYRELCLVDAYHRGRETYPQMIIMGLNEYPLTRLCEVAVATEIAKQWFSGVLAPDMINDAWLAEGLATYAAIRYMEDKYGENNSLIHLPLLPPLSLTYLNRFVYYVIQTNGMEKPISTPAYEYDDIPLSYENSTKSKPVLFLISLEQIIGKKILNEIFQQYYHNYSFNHVQSDDFIKVCQEVNGQDLSDVFNSFLNTTEFCDWGIRALSGNRVRVENKGDLKLPIDLHATTDSGEFLYSIDGLEKKYTIVIPDSMGEVSKVALDPEEHTLDPNHWNNYAPRKVSIKPVFDFDWPSFSTYQILWIPYLWYSGYDGIKAGGYIFGDNFADFDFVKGGYQATAGYTYGFKSERHYPMLNYQTPVLFEDGRRVRIRFGGSRSTAGDNVSFGLISDLGRPFTRQAQINVINTFSYNSLSTLSGLDTIDWDIGRNIVFENDLKFKHRELIFNAGLSLGHHVLGSEWEYLKMTLEAQKEFSLIVPFSLRLFVGKIFGDAPAHERLFLSGALRGSLFTNLLFGQSGTYSPQERVHIPGDGNMRGYQTLHIKSDQMYVLNLEFPTRTLIRVFTDIGYYDKFAFDVGVRLAVGSETFPFLPLYGLSVSANFPLYSYIEGEPWKFRWSFGFSL
jgi:hypothetical protein